MAWLFWIGGAVLVVAVVVAVVRDLGGWRRSRRERRLRQRVARVCKLEGLGRPMYAEQFPEAPADRQDQGDGAVLIDGR